MHEQKILGDDFNPHLKYVNLRDHGFVRLDITRNHAMANYIYTVTNEKRTLAIKPIQKVKVMSGEHRLLIE